MTFNFMFMFIEREILFGWLYKAWLSVLWDWWQSYCTLQAPDLCIIGKQSPIICILLHQLQSVLQHILSGQIWIWNVVLEQAFDKAGVVLIYADSVWMLSVAVIHRSSRLSLHIAGEARWRGKTGSEQWQSPCVNTGSDRRQGCFSLPVITCNLLLLSLLSKLWVGIITDRSTGRREWDCPWQEVQVTDKHTQVNDCLENWNTCTYVPVGASYS